MFYQLVCNALRAENREYLILLVFGKSSERQGYFSRNVKYCQPHYWWRRDEYQEVGIFKYEYSHKLFMTLDFIHKHCSNSMLIRSVGLKVELSLFISNCVTLDKLLNLSLSFLTSIMGKE